MTALFIIFIALGIALGSIYYYSKPIKKDDSNTLILTVFQWHVIYEINFLRANPATYAEMNLKDDYNKKLDNGAYEYLMNLSPMRMLIPNRFFSNSSTDFSRLLADKNLMGHDTDGSPLKRALNAGFAGSSVSENIAASSHEQFNALLSPKEAAMNFIKILIIDNLVDDLGHRLSLLNPKHTQIGAGYARNEKSNFVNYTVITLGF